MLLHCVYMCSPAPAPAACMRKGGEMKLLLLSGPMSCVNINKQPACAHHAAAMPCHPPPPNTHIGVARCLDNLCPHRGAPLSMGWKKEIEGDSCVVCPYHGWAWDSEGACVAGGPVQLHLAAFVQRCLPCGVRPQQGGSALASLLPAQICAQAHTHCTHTHKHTRAHIHAHIVPYTCTCAPQAGCVRCPPRATSLRSPSGSCWTPTPSRSAAALCGSSSAPRECEVPQPMSACAPVCMPAGSGPHAAQATGGQSQA